MNLRQFCYGSAMGVMRGLAQEFHLRPNTHYRPLGYNSARVMTLKLTGINPHYLSAITGMVNELTMWAGLDDKHKVRIGWQGYTILVEIPKPPDFWQPVTLEILAERRFIRRGPVATLGLGLQDNPLRINFAEAAMAHTFITGQTRSGKTNAQRLIGWNLVHNTAPESSKLLIFDVAKKGFKWRDFAGVAHLAHPIVSEVPEAEQVLAWLNLEIGRRGEQGYTSPRYFILIDELKALNDDSPVAAGYLSRIASIGGEFGLHLVLSTQYPQIKLLGSAELKRNVTTRLCGRVDDAQAAHNALGIPGSGAETLQGYGDFLLRDFNGLSRLTVAKIEPTHIAALPRSDTTPQLDLPASDWVNQGPSASTPLPPEPEPVALALFEPMGINKLAREVKARGLADKFSNARAQRTKAFADHIRQWALANGYRCLD